MKLILADQRAAKLKYLEHFLVSSGHDVTAVQDGVGCLESLRQSIPDVLVVAAGLRWGGTDGVLDVMFHSRKMRDTPVLLLLDHRSESQLHRHPMVLSILRTPFQPSDLERLLVFLYLVNQNSQIEDNLCLRSSSIIPRRNYNRAFGPV
ncbi:hypothetical protein VN12_19230 [Pirellula sp. SH-Sr6A]|uniref:hypothetical protein n=1 Tax=Pirellula sp. SH-Sr6A TaxID=1632865 RepID=UPI00078E24F9|nr:hypothetical protein [Pirellula sp. SH-Sr6A]AMV34267.1 hypothetical protein VN12_19230 [Pirellula sp. SH-Sr6A]